MNKETEDAKLLNPLQRNSLSTTFSVLEEMLCAIEQELMFGYCQGVMFQVTDDIPNKEEILKRISVGRMRIDALKKQFSLEKRVKEASRECLGKLSYGWEILEGAKAKYLKGYGAVAEGLAEVLDPRIDEVITIVDGIRDIINGCGSEDGGERHD